MAVIQTDKIENGLLGLWEITEEIEELLLLVNLSPEDLDTWNTFKAVQRKKEWLATRALLYELTGQFIRIGYYSDGRPYLKDYPMNISISHTRGYAAVMLHSKPNPGLDIELLSRSAEKVADRILSPDELEACRTENGYSNKKLLIHWCAKEAIFKMVPEKQVSYLKNIRIILNDQYEEAFPLAHQHISTFSGTFQSENRLLTIRLFYKEIKDLIVVWGWPN